MSGEDIVTAAVLVIGDEILSGRTRDCNINYIAAHFTRVGIRLQEVRIVADDEAAIVEAVDALRARYTYVITTGGIGPTHDDITADAIAKAMGVSIDHDPRAVALLDAYFAKRGVEPTPARMRMARIPHGAELVANAVSIAPGFMIGNVIVLAGVPDVMQVMLDDVTPRLRTGCQNAHRDDQTFACRRRCRRSLRFASTKVSGCCNGQLSDVRRRPRLHSTCSALNKFSNVGKRARESRRGIDRPRSIENLAAMRRSDGIPQ